MTVRPLDPAGAGPADVAAWHEVAEAARRADDPSHPPVALAGTRAALAAQPYDGRVLRWVASAGGEAVGTGEVFLPRTANRGWGFATVIVRPEHRRRGHGRALIEAAAAAVAAHGRETVVLTTHTGGGGA